MCGGSKPSGPSPCQDRRFVAVRVRDGHQTGQDGAGNTFWPTKHCAERRTLVLGFLPKLLGDPIPRLRKRVRQDTVVDATSSSLSSVIIAEAGVKEAFQSVTRVWGRGAGPVGGPSLFAG